MCKACMLWVQGNVVVLDVNSLYSVPKLVNSIADCCDACKMETRVSAHAVLDAHNIDLAVHCCHCFACCVLSWSCMPNESRLMACLVGLGTVQHLCVLH